MARITDENFREYVITKATEIGEIYQNAENEVKAIMDTALDANITEGTKQVAKNQIDVVLGAAVASTNDVLTTIVPVTYKNALERVKKELPKRLNDIELSPAHATQVTNLIDGAYADFGSALEGVRKQAGQALTQAQTAQIASTLATGVSEGDSVQQIASNVKETFGKNGFTAFVTKDGKRMPLKWYSEALTRTHLVRTNYTSFTTRMREVGIDIVQMSTHSGACERGIPFQGKVYSLSGKHGLPKAPALPLHPMCRHQYHARPDLLPKDSKEMQKINERQTKENISMIESRKISDNAKKKAIQEAKSSEPRDNVGLV